MMKRKNNKKIEFIFLKYIMDKLPRTDKLTQRAAFLLVLKSIDKQHELEEKVEELEEKIRDLKSQFYEYDMYDCLICQRFMSLDKLRNPNDDICEDCREGYYYNTEICTECIEEAHSLQCGCEDTLYHFTINENNEIQVLHTDNCP